MSRRISVFAMVALTTGSVASGVGCSSTDSSDAPQATAASELSTVTDAKIRASVLKAARIVASCASHAGDALDAGCVSRAAKDTAAPSEVARKAADLTHDQICAALPASGRLYYVQGIVASSAAEDGRKIAYERVWDLRARQAATFVSGERNLAGLLGPSTDGYAGFARSDGDADVVATWKDAAITGGSNFTWPAAPGEASALQWHDEAGKLSGVLGGMASREPLAKLGLTQGPAAVEDPTAIAKVAPHAGLTRLLSILPSAERVVEGAGGSYVQLGAAGDIDDGESLAIHLLGASGGQPGSISAAISAVAMDATRGLDVGTYCKGAGASSGLVGPRALHPNGGLVNAGTTRLLEGSEQLIETGAGAGMSSAEFVLAGFIRCAALGNRLTGCFTGDNRGFDYEAAKTPKKSRTWVKVDTGTGEGDTNIAKGTGNTHTIDCSATEGATKCATVNNSSSVKQCGTAPESGVGASASNVSWGERQITIDIAASDPCVSLAPNMASTVKIFVYFGTDSSGRKVISSVSWQGNTTVFPDWEFYVNGSRYAEWDAVAKGYGPTDLGFPRFWKKTVFSGSL